MKYREKYRPLHRKTELTTLKHLSNDPLYPPPLPQSIKNQPRTDADHLFGLYIPCLMCFNHFQPFAETQKRLCQIIQSARLQQQVHSSKSADYFLFDFGSFAVVLHDLKVLIFSWRFHTDEHDLVSLKTPL